MLEYDRIDVSEGIDINKRSASKECDINYKNLNYEPYLCNGCHDLMQQSHEF